LFLQNLKPVNREFRKGKELITALKATASRTTTVFLQRRDQFHIYSTLFRENIMHLNFKKILFVSL